MCYNIVQLFNWFRSILCGNFCNWGKVRCVETQAWHTDRRGGAGWRRRRRAGFELGPSSSSAPAEAFRQEKKGWEGGATPHEIEEERRKGPLLTFLQVQTGVWFKRNRTDLDLPLFLVAWGIFLLRTTLFRENWIKPFFHNYCLSLNCFAGISRTFAPFLPVLCRLKHPRLRKCAGKGKNFPDFASPLSGNKRSGNGQWKVIYLVLSSFWLLKFFLFAILDNVCGIEVVEFHTLSAFLPFTAKLWHLFFIQFAPTPPFPSFVADSFFL